MAIGYANLVLHLEDGEPDHHPWSGLYDVSVKSRLVAEIESTRTIFSVIAAMQLSFHVKLNHMVVSTFWSHVLE